MPAAAAGAGADPLARRVVRAAELEDPRHAQLRSRLSDRTEVLSPSRLDESWGRHHLAGDGTRGDHRDTIQLAKLAPAPRVTTFAMRGSLGPRGTYKGFVVQARGVRPSTSEKRDEELRMEELESNHGDDEVTAETRERMALERRVHRRLRKSIEWQQTACESRRHRIAPRGGPPARRSPDAGAMKSTHAGFSQLERDMKEYRLQLPAVSPGVSATEQLLATPPLFWDQGVDGPEEKGAYGGWGGERADWVMTMKPVPSDVGSIHASRPTTTATSRASRSRKQARRSRMRASQELSALKGAEMGSTQGSALNDSAPGMDVQIVRRWKYGEPQSVLLDFQDDGRQMTPAGKVCEDCGKTPVMFGLSYDRVIRWCVACSHDHDGATNLESAAAMVEEHRQQMVNMRKQREEQAVAEEAAWKKKQQKIFEAGSAKWEARLAEMLDPSQDTDSLPGSAALTKAGVRRAQTAAAAKLAEQRAQTPVDGPDGSSDFAGMEARNSFFDVFKRESKRRQEEGAAKCEECLEKPAVVGMKLIEGGGGLWKRHEPRWCSDCAKKHQPESVSDDSTDEVFDALTVDVDSPRRRFLADCENEGLPPLPLLIWEDDEDKRIVRLNKFRLGDKLVAAYSHGLRLLADAGVPIEQLHMEACAMQDLGVVSVTKALAKLPLLVVLDISKNRIGKQGGEALQAGLKSHKKIQTVNLSSCRLSDTVAGGLMSALRDHYSLTSLDMSSNTIGSTPAGFQPLKDMLEDQGQLKTLKFAWNSINASAMQVRTHTAHTRRYLIF
jgi:hypothetical protein